jgi:hypothetical protein
MPLANSTGWRIQRAVSDLPLRAHCPKIGRPGRQLIKKQSDAMCPVAAKSSESSANPSSMNEIGISPMRVAWSRPGFAQKFGWRINL